MFELLKSGQEVHWGPSRVLRLIETALADAQQNVPCSFWPQTLQNLIELSRPVASYAMFAACQELAHAKLRRRFDDYHKILGG